MARAEKFASLISANGETVVEFMKPRAEDDALSTALRVLTFHLLQRPEFADSRAGGVFGGAFGYGVAFEDDTFMMHPYCWCERDDCFWCGKRCECPERTIGHHLDGKPVSAAEYETWHATIEKPLPWEAPGADDDDSPEYQAAQLAFDAYIKERDRRSGRIWPAHIHTCGHAMFYSQPEDIWSGFAPQPYPDSAPHFWHKATGMRVYWYKYIGRDMNGDPGTATSCADVLEDCLRSIGWTGTLKEAVDQYANTCEEEAAQSKKAMEFLFSEEGQSLMQKMHDDGVIKTFSFGGQQPTE